MTTSRFSGFRDRFQKISSAVLSWPRGLSETAILAILVLALVALGMATVFSNVSILPAVTLAVAAVFGFLVYKTYTAATQWKKIQGLKKKIKAYLSARLSWYR